MIDESYVKELEKQNEQLRTKLDAAPLCKIVTFISKSNCKKQWIRYTYYVGQIMVGYIKHIYEAKENAIVIYIPEPFSGKATTKSCLTIEEAFDVMKYLISHELTLQDHKDVNKMSYEDMPIREAYINF